MNYLEAFPKELREYYKNLFGKEEANKIMKKLREPVEHYYIRVNTLKISREKLIGELKKRRIKTS